MSLNTGSFVYFSMYSGSLQSSSSLLLLLSSLLSLLLNSPLLIWTHDNLDIRLDIPCHDCGYLILSIIMIILKKRIVNCRPDCNTYLLLLSQNCNRNKKVKRPWPKSNQFWMWTGYISMPDMRSFLPFVHSIIRGCTIAGMIKFPIK